MHKLTINLVFARFQFTFINPGNARFIFRFFCFNRADRLVVPVYDRDDTSIILNLTSLWISNLKRHDRIFCIQRISRKSHPYLVVRRVDNLAYYSSRLSADRLLLTGIHYQLKIN